MKRKMKWISKLLLGFAFTFVALWMVPLHANAAESAIIGVNHSDSEGNNSGDTSIMDPGVNGYCYGVTGDTFGITGNGTGTIPESGWEWLLSHTQDAEGKDVYTFYLNNATFYAKFDNTTTYKNISFQKPMILNLKGNNSITTTSGNNSTGIYTQQNLDICGGGSLTINGNSFCIQSINNKTTIDNVSLECNASGNDLYSCIGLFSGATTITNCPSIICTATGTGKNLSSYIGINTLQLTIEDCGEISASAENTSIAYGIENNSLHVTNCLNIQATANSVLNNSYGIKTSSPTELTDCPNVNIRSTADNFGGAAYGFQIDSSIRLDHVTMEVTTESKSTGIQMKYGDSMEVTDSTVTCIGNSSGKGISFYNADDGSNDTIKLTLHNSSIDCHYTGEVGSTYKGIVCSANAAITNSQVYATGNAPIEISGTITCSNAVFGSTEYGISKNSLIEAGNTVSKDEAVYKIGEETAKTIFINGVIAQPAPSISDPATNISASTPFEPLKWKCDGYNGNDRLVITTQGPLCVAAFSKVTPKGFQQAFSFNLSVDGVCNYSPKNKTLVFTIPTAFYKQARQFAIIGVDKDGTAKVFTDLDQDPQTLTINIDDYEGYAFSLIYSDDTKAVRLQDTSSILGTDEKGCYYVVQKGDVLGRIAIKLGESKQYLVDKNNLSDANKISIGQKIYY